MSTREHYHSTVLLMHNAAAYCSEKEPFIKYTIICVDDRVKIVRERQNQLKKSLPCTSTVGLIFVEL
jgi:hypothetical protein